MSLGRLAGIRAAEQEAAARREPQRTPVRYLLDAGFVATGVRDPDNLAGRLIGRDPRLPTRVRLSMPTAFSAPLIFPHSDIHRPVGIMCSVSLRRPVLTDRLHELWDAPNVLVWHPVRHDYSLSYATKKTCSISFEEELSLVAELAPDSPELEAMAAAARDAYGRVIAAGGTTADAEAAAAAAKAAASPLYTLCGVVCHIGDTLDSGHYLTYVKDSRGPRHSPMSLLNPCILSLVIAA